MTLLTRIEGLVTPNQLTSTLGTAIGRTRTILNRRRAIKQEQESNRALRRMQEDAYMNSLAQDRARAEEERRRAVESERLEREKQEKTLAAENHMKLHQQWRLWKAADLKEKGFIGMKSEIGKTARVGLRLAGGERIVQMFPGDVTLVEVYSFVECYDLLFPQNRGVTLRAAIDAMGVVGEIEKPEGYEHEFMFRLVVPYPRKIIDSGLTLVKNEPALWPSGSVVVELIEDESEDDENDDSS